MDGTAPASTPKPARVLTICLGQEPKSLFLYGDSSAAARSIREAIYDGPFDAVQFNSQPVIIEKNPSMADGDVALQQVQVQKGDLIQDAAGNSTTLTEGTSYLPSGCSDQSCSQTYSGDQPVAMDQVMVRFKLKPGILWSDGSPLTAADSAYSYELAKSLLSRAQSGLISSTANYQAVDETTLEWQGIPGYKPSSYAESFFTPLPKHVWETIAVKDLAVSELANRTPMGWGPYVIDEWTAGDHITLHKNSNYFRAQEGLPAFDRLVFRFMTDSKEAVSALQAGECDFVDETAMPGEPDPSLLDLQKQGRLTITTEVGPAWEHADFGITPVDLQKPLLFGLKETRQAIAMCIDRDSMAKSLFLEPSQVSNTYLPLDHPLYAADARQYAFDPKAASDLLESVGWRDTDSNAETPRVAVGVKGVPDGTPFKFTYLTGTGDEQSKVAEQVRNSMAQCGIQVDISSTDYSQLFAPGPQGPIFGRQFDMAQYAWTTSSEPPCYLYTSSQIPGPYPDYPKGWGGANAAGYNSPEYDQACLKASFSLPDSPEYQDAQRKAQIIFAEDLPVIPLYLRMKMALMRPDMCGVVLDPSASSSLWNLEAFNYGADCKK